MNLHSRSFTQLQYVATAQGISSGAEDARAEAAAAAFQIYCCCFSQFIRETASTSTATRA
jgi:hypothetical protein